MPSDFDKKCGTYGTGDYQESSGKCDGPFICTEGDETDEMKAFGECLYAMDCAMEVGMQSILNNENPIVTFIHQMIPHHANAVNMAKALLKTNTLDDSVEEDADMLKIVMEIINVQNFQINQMQGYLAGGGYPPEESCDDPEPTGWSKKREPSKDCERVSRVADMPLMNRGDAAAGDVEIPLRRVAATPRLATWRFRGDESRRRRGWRRGGSVETSRGDAAAGDVDTPCRHGEARLERGSSVETGARRRWASEHLPQRCDVKGADGTLAKDSCPELAKKCK